MYSNDVRLLLIHKGDESYLAWHNIVDAGVLDAGVISYQN